MELLPESGVRTDVGGGSEKRKGTRGQDKNETGRTKKGLEKEPEKRQVSDYYDFAGYYLLSGFLLFSDDRPLDGIHAVQDWFRSQRAVSE